MDLMPLKFVRAGAEAEVGEVTGDQSQVQRLQEMGICTGCRLKVVCPGSPCIVQIAGTKLCFRDNDMTNVFVKVGAAI